MFRIPGAAAILPLLLSLLLGGCAATGDDPATAALERPSDSEVIQRVQTALAGDELLQQQNIRVESDDGQVTLYGRVSGRAANRAISVARSTPGVRWVISRLEIGP